MLDSRPPLKFTFDRWSQGNFQHWLKYINSHTNLCQRKYEESSQLEVREVQVESYKSDSRVLREYIEHFPLQGPKIVQSEMLKQKQRFKKRQIIQMIQDVRNSLFPRDLEMVFTLAIVEQLTLKKQLLIYLNIMDVYLTFQKKVISPRIHHFGKSSNAETIQFLLAMVFGRYV